MSASSTDWCAGETSDSGCSSVDTSEDWGAVACGGSAASSASAPSNSPDSYQAVLDAVSPDCSDTLPQWRGSLGKCLVGLYLAFLLQGTLACTFLHAHDMFAVGLYLAVAGVGFMATVQCAAFGLLSWQAEAARLLHSRIFQTVENWQAEPVRSALESGFWLAAVVTVQVHSNNFLAAVEIGTVAGVAICLGGEWVSNFLTQRGIRRRPTSSSPHSEQPDKFLLTVLFTFLGSYSVYLIIRRSLAVQSVTMALGLLTVAGIGMIGLFAFSVSCSPTRKALMIWNRRLQYRYVCANWETNSLRSIVELGTLTTVVCCFYDRTRNIPFSMLMGLVAAGLLSLCIEFLDGWQHRLQSKAKLAIDKMVAVARSLLRRGGSDSPTEAAFAVACCDGRVWELIASNLLDDWEDLAAIRGASPAAQEAVDELLARSDLRGWLRWGPCPGLGEQLFTLVPGILLPLACCRRRRRQWHARTQNAGQQRTTSVALGPGDLLQEWLRCPARGGTRATFSKLRVLPVRTAPADSVSVACQAARKWAQLQVLQERAHRLTLCALLPLDRASHDEEVDSQGLRKAATANEPGRTHAGQRAVSHQRSGRGHLLLPAGFRRGHCGQRPAQQRGRVAVAHAAGGRAAPAPATVRRGQLDCERGRCHGRAPSWIWLMRTVDSWVVVQDYAVRVLQQVYFGRSVSGGYVLDG